MFQNDLRGLCRVAPGVLTIAIFLIGCAPITKSQEHPIETNLGKLILMHEKAISYEKGPNLFGSGPVFGEFLQVYDEQIGSMATKDKVEFLWAAMWHLDFDGHYMEQFQQIVMTDCPQEFKYKLGVFIEWESQKRSETPRLRKAAKVLRGLEILEERRQH